MDELLSIESIGWIATIVVAIDSAPVIVASALVLSAACWSVLRARRNKGLPVVELSRSAGNI